MFILFLASLAFGLCYNLGGFMTQLIQEYMRIHSKWVYNSIEGVPEALKWEYTQDQLMLSWLRTKIQEML